MSRPSPLPDPAVTAIRAALAYDGHDVEEVLILSVGADPRHLIVRFNPDGDDWAQEEDRCAAYARTLQRAGWSRALDLESLVLVPDVPAAGTQPGRYTATWQITADTGPVATASEALWTLTDHVGRTTSVTVSGPFRP
ncbi:hypothetical protein [Streptomyces murinus]|uniref:hypothetical protein n=1 Tax=Streptomyces murinus TaxID=33900 RepID=UPI0037FA2EFC